MCTAPNNDNALSDCSLVEQHNMSILSIMLMYYYLCYSFCYALPQHYISSHVSLIVWKPLSILPLFTNMFVSIKCCNTVGHILVNNYCHKLQHCNYYVISDVSAHSQWSIHNIVYTCCRFPILMLPKWFQT